MKGNDHGLIQDSLCPGICVEGLNKIKRDLGRLANVQADIRTGHLPNMIRRLQQSAQFFPFQRYATFIVTGYKK